jgi:hypothetical protein
LSNFKIYNLSYKNNELFVEWVHDFKEVDNFCVILDQEGSCEFRTTNNPNSVSLPNIEPGEYLVKVQVLADGSVQETPGKIITI